MALSHKYLEDRYAQAAWEVSQPEDGEYWHNQAVITANAVVERVGAAAYNIWYGETYPNLPPTWKVLFRAMCKQYRYQLLAPNPAAVEP